MNPIASLVVSIGADLTGLHKGLQGAGATLKQQAGVLGNAAKQVGSVIAVGVTGGLVALAGGLAASVKAAADAEEGQAALAAVLASTGGKAGVTAQMANELAASLQNVTRFEDDTILAGENLLLTFTNIGADVFPQATETMLNMAQAMGGDVKSAAIQLGKAINDPTKGMTALTRVGVTFTEQQKEQIKALQESGDLMGAQKIILAELETEFGGAARAAGNTFAGKLDILQNKFGDIMETIGGALIPVLTEVATVLADVLGSPEVQAAIEIITKGLTVGVQILAGVIKDFVGGLKNGNLEGAFSVFGTLQTILAQVWAFVQPILAQVFGELSKFWTEIQPKLAAAWNAIYNGIIVPVVTAIMGFLKAHGAEIRALFEGLWKYVSGVFQVAWSLISGIIKIALDLIAGDTEAAGKDFQEMMRGIWDGVRLIIAGAWQAIQALALIALSDLAGAVNNKMEEVKQGIIDRFNAALQWMGELPVQFFNLGHNAIQGLIDGFWSNASALGTALQDIVTAAIDSILALFGLGGAGAAVGDLFGAGAGGAGFLSGSAAGSSAGVAAGAHQTIFNFNVTVSDQADEDRLARKIRALAQYA